MKLPHLEKNPDIHESVYVDPTARIIGDVVVERSASIWCNVSVRGDVHAIRIGEGTNIQDNCSLHGQRDEFDLVVGPHVVVGHAAVLHGCRIAGPALIGMGAVIMNGAVIEEDVVIAAGALVPEGRVIPGGTLAMGIPARPVRKLNPQELDHVREGWKDYAAYVEEYRRQGRFHGWGRHPLRPGSPIP